jgi:hypothetical protein
MLSVKDFIDKYEQYSDDELFEVNSNIEDYSPEAKEALYIVLANKGGLEKIEKKIADKKIISDEIIRIKVETSKLSSKETNAEFIKTLVSSNILSKDDVDKIIDEKFGQFEAHVKDTTIDSKTIVQALIGTVIASILGGILWGLQMIYSKRIFYIFILGLAMLCYGIVKLTTKKSKENRVVFIAVVLSFILSMLFGTLIYQVIGYQE